MLPQALDQIADRGFLHELGMSLEAACISASVTAHAAAFTNAPERSTSNVGIRKPQSLDPAGEKRDPHSRRLRADARRREHRAIRIEARHHHSPRCHGADERSIAAAGVEDIGPVERTHEIVDYALPERFRDAAGPCRAARIIVRGGDSDCRKVFPSSEYATQVLDDGLDFLLRGVAPETEADRAHSNFGGDPHGGKHWR